VFTRGALRQIVEHAKGVPRVINILCDNALVNGLGYQKKPVTARIVREAIADLTGRTRVQWLPWAWASLVAVLAAGALFLASPYRELVFASGNAPVELPALPSAPARALPVAAGDEDWLPPGEGGVAGSPVSAWGDGMAANASGEGVVATAVVREGDTLHALAAGVYGFADARILRRILEINPDIKNSDTLLVGTTIRFPAVRVAGARTPQLR
jgi:general secretion pathway protein A